jgi:hypothetical protein
MSLGAYFKISARTPYQSLTALSQIHLTVCAIDAIEPTITTQKVSNFNQRASSDAFPCISSLSI